jgi:hypothetical protein
VYRSRYVLCYNTNFVCFLLSRKKHVNVLSTIETTMYCEYKGPTFTQSCHWPTAARSHPYTELHTARRVSSEEVPRKVGGRAPCWQKKENKVRRLLLEGPDMEWWKAVDHTWSGKNLFGLISPHPLCSQREEERALAMGKKRGLHWRDDSSSSSTSDSSCSDAKRRRSRHYHVGLVVSPLAPSS